MRKNTNANRPAVDNHLFNALFVVKQESDEIARNIESACEKVLAKLSESCEESDRAPWCSDETENHVKHECMKVKNETDRNSEELDQLSMSELLKRYSEVMRQLQERRRLHFEESLLLQAWLLFPNNTQN